MANKNKGKRSGGKSTGSHTTLVSAAETVYDIVHAFPEVTKISVGIIKSGCGPTPKNRVKIMDEQGALLLKIRGNGVVQELRVYTSERAKVKDGLKNSAEKEGFEVSFAEA